MARSTRQQRRQRRAQAAGTPPLRPAPRPQVEEAAPVEQAAAEERPFREEPRSGLPGIRFAQESIAELKKVEWPSQSAVVSGTAVVLVACVLVGTYLWVNDQLWKYVVQHVFKI